MIVKKHYLFQFKKGQYHSVIIFLSFQLVTVATEIDTINYVQK